MGTFNIMTATFFIGSALALIKEEGPLSLVQSFKTSYLDDPWILPTLLDSREDSHYSEIVLSLFASEIVYQAIHQLL